LFERDIQSQVTGKAQGGEDVKSLFRYFFVRTSDQQAVAECGKLAVEEYPTESYTTRPTIIDKPKDDLAIYVKTEIEDAHGKRRMVKVFQVTVESVKGLKRKFEKRADADDICLIQAYDSRKIDKSDVFDAVEISSVLYEYLLRQFGWDNVKVYYTYIS